MRLGLVLVALLTVCAAPAQAETLRPDFVVCRSKQQLTQVVQAAVDGNLSVIDGLLGKGVCRGTQGGEKVAVLSRSGAYATIRFAGSRQRWLTVVEAVQ